MEIGARIAGEAVWRATAEAPKPDVSFVPMMTRRRLTSLERAAFRAAYDAVAAAGLPFPPPEMPVVFASRWGEIGTTFELIRARHETGETSPALFSSSVHNAMPGAWSLFTRNHAPYTAIAAGPDSRAMGLVEARAQLTEAPRVLFIYAEEATPDFYRSAIDEPETACAEAAVLERAP